MMVAEAIIPHVCKDGFTSKIMLKINMRPMAINGSTSFRDEKIAISRIDGSSQWKKFTPRCAIQAAQSRLTGNKMSW